MSEGREHGYAVQLRWTGNEGRGTAGYRAYSREHEIHVSGKPVLVGSADPAFRGDASRYNPEDLLVAALSACHMLWYLHLCSDAGIVVTGYTDEAHGVMVQDASGGGRFREVTLRPTVTLAPGSDSNRGEALHADAHRRCFIANSVNFPVRCEAVVQAGG